MSSRVRSQRVQAIFVEYQDTDWRKIRSPAALNTGMTFFVMDAVLQK